METKKNKAGEIKKTRGKAATFESDDYSPKSDKDLNPIIAQYLDQFSNKEERENAGHRLLEYFGYDSVSEFKKAFQNHKEKKKGQQKRMFEYVVRALHFSFGFSYSSYLGEEKVYPLGREKPDSLKRFESFEDMDNFIDKYCGAVNGFIQQAYRRIWVYEYLAKGRSHYAGQALVEYSQAHRILFKSIERRLFVNTGMEYKRLLVLPFSNLILSH